MQFTFPLSLVFRTPFYSLRILLRFLFVSWIETMTVAGRRREREMASWSAARGCALPCLALVTVVLAAPDRRLLPLFVVCWRCFCLFYTAFRLFGTGWLSFLRCTLWCSETGGEMWRAENYERTRSACRGRCGSSLLIHSYLSFPLFFFFPSSRFPFIKQLFCLLQLPQSRPEC